MKISAILLVLILINAHTVIGQYKTVKILFSPFFEKNPLVLNKTIYAPGTTKDSLTIQSFRFYMSSVELYNGQQLAWQEKNSYHLIDLAAPETMNFSLQVPGGLQYTTLRFGLGIDSATNAGGAGGGDLDATKGMYWAWHSGYINFKLEGIHSRCNTRRKEFQFHLGGFRQGEYCLQVVSLPLTGNDNIQIITDIAVFIKTLNIASQNTVTTPGSESIKLSEMAAKIFSTKTQL